MINIIEIRGYYFVMNSISVVMNQIIKEVIQIDFGIHKVVLSYIVVQKDMIKIVVCMTIFSIDPNSIKVVLNNNKENLFYV